MKCGPGVLADEDATLDLLAVSTVIANADQLSDAERDRWLHGSDRWREAMHFRTSRETDRGRDEDVDGETDVTVFRESTRAAACVVRPRWSCRCWMRTPLRAVKTSRFPYGRRFDPRTVAVVDPATPLPVSHFRPGRIPMPCGTRVCDGDIGIARVEQSGGFLVLSENAYPGWRARIDGADTLLSIAPT